MKRIPAGIYPHERGAGMTGTGGDFEEGSFYIISRDNKHQPYYYYNQYRQCTI